MWIICQTHPELTRTSLSSWRSAHSVYTTVCAPRVGVKIILNTHPIDIKIQSVLLSARGRKTREKSFRDGVVWFHGSRFNHRLTFQTCSLAGGSICPFWVHTMSNNGHETRQSPFATLPLILHWNTKRGPFEPSNTGEMVKGWWTLYGAQSHTTHATFIRSPTHSSTDGRGCHAGCQPAHQGQYCAFYLQYFYQSFTLEWNKHWATVSIWPKDTAEQHINTISLLKTVRLYMGASIINIKILSLNLFSKITQCSFKMTRPTSGWRVTAFSKTT